MNSRTWTDSAAAPPRSRARPLQAAARKALVARLRHLRWGQIALSDEWGEATLGGATADAAAPSVRLRVLDPRAYLDIVAGGSPGAGKSFVLGRWQCDDLVGLVRILVRNRDVLTGLERGWARLGALGLRWYHARRDNTPAGSRENIASHYDLSNDFYRLFLDESMMYSCAIFEREGQDLEQAQAGRLERIGQKLELSPADHVLEIGTGWGALSIHAARRFGCRVTTTTISRAQFELATERVRAAGLEGCVTVLLEDYRELTGQYDKLVSVEMIEAVGERWFDEYFTRCSALLRPEGMMLLQAITIRDQHYAQALREVDFIQRYVFPGSCIPCTSAILERVARCTDMSLFHLEDIGPHYVHTLREWRRRLLAKRDQVRSLGFDEQSLRLWEFYFGYCEGGFSERVISAAQMLFTKPLCRRAALVPPLVAKPGAW
jgi:cyclopropane-fatty-acyl-phospholipid synthase